MTSKYKTTSYRYPNENLILGVTILVVLGVIVFTAAATVCLSGFFVIGVLVIGYHAGRSHHRSLVQSATEVTETSDTKLSHSIEICAQRLQVEPVQVFILPSKIRNAYTFGMASPKALVIYSSLIQILDDDELRFIIGHEMGHICLGHTWLNSLVGGMSGIPSSITSAILMQMAFLWWNRSCEYSADRAGMLACGNPRKALSALIKLEVGSAITDPAQLNAILRRIDDEDDSLLNDLGEVFATHPKIFRRIENIQSYASSSEYTKLQGLMNQNLV